MKFSRFMVTLTIILGVFLFILGTCTLYYINNVNNLPVFAQDQNNNNDNINKDIRDKNPKDPTDNNNFKNTYPVNFLLLIGDQLKTNTDFLALVNYNPVKEEFSLLSIPRDTKVLGAGIKYPKVNSLYFRQNGQKLAVNTISNMLKVNIKYFVYIDLSTFREIIDLLGGVEIYVPADLNYDDPEQDLHIHIKKGLKTLDGKTAEEYLRFRKPNNNRYTEELLKYYDGSDLCRIEAQQNFLRELIKQKSNFFHYTKISKILQAVFDNLTTNATMEDVLTLVKSIPSLNLDKVNFYTLPGNVTNNNNDFFEINEQKASDIIAEHFYSKGNVKFNSTENAIGAG